MTTTSGHLASAELVEVPRPSGRFRQFWAARPRLTDALIAAFCFISGSPSAVLMAEMGAETLGKVSTPVRILVITLVGLSSIALLVRRKYPVPVYAFAAVAVLSTAVGGFAVSLFSGIVAIYSVAVYRSPRVGWICVGVTAPLIVAANYIALSYLDDGRESVYIVPVAAFMVGFLLIGLLVGANVYGIRRYQGALIERARQLEVQSDQRAELAASAERARIAREMHDVVSHSLTVVVALAEGATATNDRERATKATQAIAVTARNALTNMRSMLGVLRSDDHDAPLEPLTADTVDQIVSGARAAGYPITLTTSGTDHTMGRSALALSRVVQEGLTNAMRHANAQTIAVMLHHEPEDTTVRIENDGVRPVTGTPGFGLRGLRERVEHVGGTITAGLTTAGTWRLEATIPARADGEVPVPDETAEESA